MAAWGEQNGILSKKNGFVEIGYHCFRCEAHWQITMPQDDYSEEAMKKELCYACDLRRQLAQEKWHYRQMNRRAFKIIQSMEAELNILLQERKNHENLVEIGSQLITQQDGVIRDLKKQLDKRAAKK